MQSLQDKPLNLHKLKRLIDSGISAIPIDKKHDKAILVIGDTGVGKTTILSFLAQKKLVVKVHGLNTILDSDDNDGLKIGHDRFSETRVPSKIVIDNLAYFDCSGFKDNRGEEFQISNSFFVQRLFEIYNKVKILLIIDQSSVSETRADKLPKLVRNLLKSFENLKDIQDGVILLINRAKKDYSEKDYKRELLKMADLKGEDGYLFKKEEKDFIEFLVNHNKVCIFKQAEKQNSGKALHHEKGNLNDLIKDANYVKSKKIKNIISESAKLAIRDLIDKLSSEADSKISTLCENLVRQITSSERKGFGGNLEDALKVKQKILDLIGAIEKAKNQELVELLREKVSPNDFLILEQDVMTVLFFNTIYNKAQDYFRILRSKIASSLSKSLISIDSEITVLQEHQKHLNELKEKCINLQSKSETLEQTIESFRKKTNAYEHDLIEEKQKYEKITEEMKEMSHKKDKGVEELNKLVEEKKKYEKITEEMKEIGYKKDKEVEELNKLIEELELKNESQAEEIELLSMENESMKSEMDNISVQSVSSTTSRASKYPDVICPHFKNGGKCKHCIKAWKDSEKKRKKEEKG